jgi:D-amino-acid oxidase
MTSQASKSPDCVILGAGIVGLTTAMELKDRYPDSEIVIVAKYVPGDRSVEYCSPWAGANWCSMATDNGPAEARDFISYHKFAALVKSHPHCGIEAMPIVSIYDASLEDAGVLSEGTGKVWYEKLVGGLRDLEEGVLEKHGALTGFEFDSWVIDTSVYLGWYVVHWGRRSQLFSLSGRHEKVVFVKGLLEKGNKS